MPWPRPTEPPSLDVISAAMDATCKLTAEEFDAITTIARSTPHWLALLEFAKFAYDRD